MKILFGSDSINSIVGFGTVVREIALRLARKGFECYCLGYQYAGQPIRYAGTTLLPNLTMKRYGEDSFEFYFKTLKPDCLFTLSDPWTIDHLVPIKDKPSWIQYLVFDHSPTFEGWKEIFENARFRIAATQFGKRALDSVVPDLDNRWIWHGVDTKTFFPLALRDRVNNLRIRMKIPEDSFIFLSVFRNTERKRADRLLEAFEIFLTKNKVEDAYLVLHTDPFDPYPTAQNLIGLIKRLKLERNVRFSPLQTNYFFGCSQKELNILYNLADCFVIASDGEGFCLPVAESFAVGKPVIGTNYSSFPELIGSDEERGWLIKVDTYFLYSKYLMRRALCSIEDLAEKMKIAYEDRNLLQSKGRRALEFARANLDWDRAIIPQWIKILDEI